MRILIFSFLPILRALSSLLFLFILTILFFPFAILFSVGQILHKICAYEINLYRFNVPEELILHKINALSKINTLSKINALPKINALSKIKPLHDKPQIMLYILTSKLNYERISQCENAAQLISLIKVLSGS